MSAFETGIYTRSVKKAYQQSDIHHQHQINFDMAKTHLMLFHISNILNTTVSHKTDPTRRATALGSAARAATAIRARAGRHIDSRRM
jgi:hypothetical protein